MSGVDESAVADETTVEALLHGHRLTTPVQCACGWRETDPGAGTWAAHVAEQVAEHTRKAVDEAFHRGVRQGADLVAHVLVMEWDAETTFPFTEDENANITGFGHQDPHHFAAAVNRYDEIANGEPYPEDEQWTADHIYHRWLTLDPDNDERFIPCEATTAGALPVTTLWGQR